MSRTIAIIGAGPIGLEAALAARQAGFSATVYEAGEVADSVRRWGHIRMFSPFHMNASAAGLGLLTTDGLPLPAADACLTGDQFVESYLKPLAQHLKVITRCRVLSIVRENSGKRDHIGEPGRADTPFRLTLEQNGTESQARADIILDCSGTFQNPNPLGDGGVPALGERAAAGRIHYGVESARDLASLAGQRILVAGGGHSAANLIAALVELKAAHPATEIHWIIRRTPENAAAPCALVPGDPLPGRARICARANQAATTGEVRLHPGTAVTSLKPAAAGLHAESNEPTADRLTIIETAAAFDVTLKTPAGQQTVTVDHLFAATGFRPDWSFARELHIQTCWATEGTYPLAASLLGESGGDCLAVPAQGADTLLHPEPGFYALGMKSYGRTPDFLIATGLQQITSLFSQLQADRGGT